MDDADFFSEPVIEEAPQAPQAPAFDPSQFVPREQFNQLQSQVQEVSQFKQGLSQLIGGNQPPAIDPAVQQAYDMIDKRVSEKFGLNEGGNKAPGVAEIMQTMQATSAAQELGFQNIRTSDGQFITAWDAAKSAYDPLLQQIYYSVGNDAQGVQLKAQIENIYNLASTPGQEKAALQQAAQLTRYSPQSFKQQSVNQSIGHIPGSSQSANTPAYASSDEWTNDYYSNDPVKAKRAEAALMAGRVPGMQ